MRCLGHHTQRHLLVAGVAVLGLVPIASAQVADGGKVLRLTFGQSLIASDNLDLVAEPEGDALRAATQFGLAYSDITRTQRLTFVTRGTYETNTEDTAPSVADPFAELTYAREGANSRLSFSAEYRRTDLDDTFLPLAFLIPGASLPDDVVNEVARIEGGLRTDTFYNFEFETGLQSAVGFRLDLGAQDRRYADLGVFDLADSTVRRAEVETSFRIDPTITARLTAAGRLYEADDADQAERLTTSYGAGVAFELSPITSWDIYAGQRRVRTERDSVVRETDGTELRTRLTRALSNGEIEVNLTSEPTLTGRNTTLRLNRDMVLRREGQLRYGLGVSRIEDLGSEPLFELAYVQPLKRGRFGVELSQVTRTDENSDEPIVLSRLSANYAVALTPATTFSVQAVVDDVAARRSTADDRRGISLRSDLAGQINDISSWSIGTTLSDIRTFGLSTDTRERRYGLQLSYRRAVTPDWNMVAQYQHSTILDDATTDRRSNTISFGLERTFDTRF